MRDLRRLFRRIFSPGWPVGFRWMLLLALVLVFGRERTGVAALARVFAYLPALGLHELMHWLIAGSVFPGMPRRVVLAPLGGPAPVPPAPSRGTVVWSLVPALTGSAAGIILMVEAPAGFSKTFGTFLLLISAANLLPFYPLDGHVWCSAALRRMKIAWRFPSWREYLGILGGIGLALSAFGDILGMGELALVGGLSILVDNLYLLMRMRRGAASRPVPTGFPSPKRVDPGERRRLDDILQRVAQVGIDGISEDDRKFLEQMSQRYRK